MKPIPFNKPFIIGRELSCIADAVAQGQLSGDGGYTRLCHRWLEEKLGTRRALLIPIRNKNENKAARMRRRGQYK